MKLLSRRPSVVVLANVIANVSKIVGRRLPSDWRYAQPFTPCDELSFHGNRSLVDLRFVRRATGDTSHEEHRRATRRHFSVADKNRILLEGQRGKDRTAELCRCDQKPLVERRSRGGREGRLLRKPVWIYGGQR